MCVDCTNSINDTPQGTAGEDGISSYIYIATATSSTGSNFNSYTNEPTQCWKAIRTSSTPLPFEVATFAGLWFNTCGTPGSNGSNGTGSQGPKGDAASIAIYEPTITGAAGSAAYVENIGTNYDAEFQFTIPKGDKGDDGADGSVWTNGIGDPGSLLAVNDYYLDTASGDVWTNVMGVNTIVTSILGPAGLTGETGATGAAGAPQNVTSTDGSVTVTTPVANTFNLSVNFTEGWVNIPYDDATYPFNGTDFGTNGRYRMDPLWATMTGTYTMGADVVSNSSYNIYAYNAQGGSFTSNSSRIMYKKNSDGTTNVKGLLRKVINKPITNTFINLQDLSTGVKVDVTTYENGVQHGRVLDNNLIWFYPMIGLNLTDLTNISGLVNCIIYIDDKQLANLNNYALSDSNKILTANGTLYFSKNSLRLYAQDLFTQYSTSSTFTNFDSPAQTYTMSVFINGTI